MIFKKTLRKISAESWRGVLNIFQISANLDGVFYYFQKVSAQFERGFFNNTRFKSADFGQNRCFQAQKDLKIFFALRAGDQIYDFL